jgi:predicted amidohydrolase
MLAIPSNKLHSAFRILNKKARWETILRAKAIETQSYVVASVQVGRHNEKQVSYGHSLVIHPWGKVKCELGGEWNGKPEMGFLRLMKRYLRG